MFEVLKNGLWVTVAVRIPQGLGAYTYNVAVTAYRHVHGQDANPDQVTVVKMTKYLTCLGEDDIAQADAAVAIKPRVA